MHTYNILVYSIRLISQELTFHVTKKRVYIKHRFSELENIGEGNKRLKIEGNVIDMNEEENVNILIYEIQ